MRNRWLLFGLACLLARPAAAQVIYNPLWIPDTLAGPTFNLELVNGMRRFLPGGVGTHTHYVRGAGRTNPNFFWGPTLLFRHGDTVRLAVANNLPDTTTVHWHGFDLPPQMDGGPHQPVPPATVWRPFFQVKNPAATYWYHPHLHMMTEHQVTKGLGGMIIVRDPVESALPLPRRYGVDDLPLALTDRRFDSLATNQFAMAHYGDTVLVNGTLNPTRGVPAQVVRLRVLNAAVERSYNLGFADNRPFYVITNDGGMLAAPVAVTRFLLSVGERVELLVDFGGQQGQVMKLVAYNDQLPPDVPGAEPANDPRPYVRNRLGGRRFDLLRLTVDAPTTGAITTIPAILRPVVAPDTAAVSRFRHLNMSDALVPGAPPGAGWFDGQFFDFHRIDQRVELGATEIWEVENQSQIAHPFHVHDVQFYVLSRNFQPAPAWEQAWKDVVLVHQSETVQLLATFHQAADSTMPFMYHCHINYHEDGGMMGQFTVRASATGAAESLTSARLMAYPNPVRDAFRVRGAAAGLAYEVVDALGRPVQRGVTSLHETAVEMGDLSPGLYVLRLAASGQAVRFVKQ